MENYRTDLARAALDPSVSETKIVAAIEALSGNCKKDTHTRYMSEKEACTYLGNIARTSIYRFRKLGLHSYSAGSRVLYKQSDLEDFVNNRNKACITRITQKEVI